MRAESLMMSGSCLSCGKVKSTRVKKWLILDGLLIRLQLTQAQILWLLLVLHFCIGILFWPCARAGPRLGRLAPHVVVPAHNLHEGGAYHDARVGIEVKEMGLVSKSVEANASLAS